LQILTYALQLPSGIHHKRWPALKKMRFGGVLVAKQLIDIVLEALYAGNTVTLGFDECKAEDYLKGWFGDLDLLCIKYPTSTVNHWICHLIINLRVDPIRFNYHPWQVRWLQKLASGRFGFERLRSLRLSFNMSVVIMYWNEFCNHLESWVYCLETHKVRPDPRVPLVFNVPSVAIVVAGNQCDERFYDKNIGIQHTCLKSPCDRYACTWAQALGVFFCGQ
jgi:hypothetical protein